MTEQHLHGNKFLDWKGWDVLKWITGLVILAVVLLLIYTDLTGGMEWFYQKLSGIFSTSR
jgi:hypothetical protein